MPTGQPSARHLVYLRSTRRDAKRLAVYATAFLVLAIGGWAVGFPRAVTYLLFGIASCLALLSGGNLVASFRHAKAVRGHRPSQQELAQASIELEEDVKRAGDIVRTIEMDGSHPEIRFVCSKGREQVYERCAEKLCAGIEGDKAKFLSRFSDFKALNGKRYPDLGDLLENLTIDYLIVFANGHARCIARVHFAGELGEVWVNGVRSCLLPHWRVWLRGYGPPPSHGAPPRRLPQAKGKT